MQVITIKSNHNVLSFNHNQIKLVINIDLSWDSQKPCLTFTNRRLTSTTAKPLHDLTAKDVRFSWDQQHEKAFEKIKELVKADVVLTFPDFTKPFYISFDASELGIGATLQQMSDKGQLRPLEFYS
ncbi:hypothetical protein SeLEV6574_g00726, partial [Synchytrium endobioticum]